MNGARRLPMPMSLPAMLCRLAGANRAGDQILRSGGGDAGCTAQSPGQEPCHRQPRSRQAVRPAQSRKNPRRHLSRQQHGLRAPAGAGSESSQSPHRRNHDHQTSGKAVLRSDDRHAGQDHPEAIGQGDGDATSRATITSEAIINLPQRPRRPAARHEIAGRTHETSLVPSPSSSQDPARHCAASRAKGFVKSVPSRARYSSAAAHQPRHGQARLLTKNCSNAWGRRGRRLRCAGWCRAFVLSDSLPCSFTFVFPTPPSPPETPARLFVPSDIHDNGSVTLVAAQPLVEPILPGQTLVVVDESPQKTALKEPNPIYGRFKIVSVSGKEIKIQSEARRWLSACSIR